MNNIVVEVIFQCKRSNTKLVKYTSAKKSATATAPKTKRSDVAKNIFLLEFMERMKSSQILNMEKKLLKTKNERFLLN